MKKPSKHSRKIKASHDLRKKYLALNADNRHARVMGYLKKIDPYVFEELVLTSLDNIGFNITRSRSYSGDGGIDGLAKFEGKTWLIQSKRYKDYINPDHVKNFVTVTSSKECSGLFIHTGKTGRKSHTNKSGKIKIISGNKLTRLVLGTITARELIGN